MKHRSNFKLRTNRKAQIHISETIAVLFIFFVLILFGMVFYYKYSQYSLKEKQEEIIANQAMDATLKALFLPELICSKGKAEPEDNCIDLVKLRQVNQTFAKHLNDYYYQMFHYSRISVYAVYPESHLWIIYDKPKPEYTKIEPTFFVVTLRDDIKGSGSASYGFGYLKLEVYS